MKKGNILILGSSSFVAFGLYDLLKANGYNVNSFRRGKIYKEGDYIYGDVFHLSDNPYLCSQYDVVINFIVIKDGDVNENIRYINSVVDFCKSHSVKKFIHFSSIMVYNYALKEVTENSEMETLQNTIKKGYGAIKIGIDQYLMHQKADFPFELILVRPGYVLADNRPCPFIKKLVFGFSIIKGNRKSKQPIVRREDIHQALIKIIELKENLPVYHFFPNDGMTKYRYAKQVMDGTILTMPKCIFKYIPLLLSKVGIIPKSLYSRFEGMYIESNFNSNLTEEKLNIQFK